MNQFDNYLSNYEATAHAINPSHICDWPDKEIEEVEVEPQSLEEASELSEDEDE